MLTEREPAYGGYFVPIERFGPRDALVRAEGTRFGDGWLWFRDPLEDRPVRASGDLVATIAWAEDVARAGDWSVGYVAYEAAPAFDPALQTQPGRGDLPLAYFRRYRRPTFWNTLSPGPSPPPAAWRPEWDAQCYASAFAEVRRALAHGESYQANLTFRTRSKARDPRDQFARWAADDPPPYALFWGDEDYAIACLSPELFFERRGDELIGRPMKGTAPVESAANALPSSEKERAENLMVVDMIRNDFGRIARTGSVSVPALFRVERHGSLYQMTSTVSAKSDAPLADVFRALFPCASIIGAPKVATTGLLARLETSPRGVYTGAIGWVAPGGDARFAVAIRTVTFQLAKALAEYGVGSGIVWDSRCDSEWEECLLKTSALERVSPPWELLETMRYEPERGIALEEQHLDRMANSARDLGIGFSREGARAWLAERTSSLAEPTRLRLRLGRDGKTSLDLLPLKPTPTAMTAAWAGSPVASQDRAMRHKSTYRSAYSKRLAEVATDEVLLWNERGEATEFANGSLIAERGGERVTPPVDSGCLPGTYVAWRVAVGDVTPCPLKREDVASASRLWFANSVVGEVPVRLVG